MDSTAITYLEHLPATDLHHLYLGYSAVFAYHDFHSCISKWRHSLTDLDLSWNDFRDGVLQSALDALCQPPAPTPLQNLNLAGTPVNMSQLKLMTNDLMAKFNVSGNKGKLALHKTAAYLVILESAHKTFPSTEHAKKVEMDVCLKYAPDRRGGGGRRIDIN